MTAPRLLLLTALLAAATPADAARKAAELRPSRALIARVERKLEAGWNFGTPFRQLARFYALSPDRKQVGGSISATSGTGPNRLRNGSPSMTTHWRPGAYTVRWKHWPSFISAVASNRCIFGYFLYDIGTDRFVQRPCSPLPKTRRAA